MHQRLIDGKTLVLDGASTQRRPVAGGGGEIHRKRGAQTAFGPDHQSRKNKSR